MSSAPEPPSDPPAGNNSQKPDVSPQPATSPPADQDGASMDTTPDQPPEETWDDIPEEIKTLTTEEILTRIRLIDSDIEVMKSDTLRLQHEQSVMKEKIRDNGEKITRVSSWQASRTAMLPFDFTFRAVFAGPLTALDPTSRKGTKQPKGVIHGMTEPSGRAVAYAAIQLIVTLSSAEQWASEVNGLDLYELYLSIVSTLENTDYPWTSRRKNRHPIDDMDGFLDGPRQRPPAHSSPPPDHSTAHRSAASPPPEHRPRQNPSSPPPECRPRRSLSPPPHECSRPPPSPQPSNRCSSGSVQDEELTPLPATPSPKHVRRGRGATRRKR
ncbi:hypothetical protein M405DRAFT_901810 [Rhizopogon salebrosus TDB-379]|nr:hypothetical protein M405DRAFT_901810 [Rhizopogon salebrosus TDB-379]